MPTLSANGQTLAYDDTGGEGPAIVFSHGLLMDRAMFAPQVQALRATHRVISWDARGHGETGPADAPFSYWDSAADLLALLDALGVEHAIFAGMSQGGFVSLRVALLAPERVDALILIDTQAGTEDAEKIPYYESLLGAWAADGLSDEVGGVIGQIILGAGWDGTPEWIERWRTMPAEGLATSFQTLLSREDIHERLPEIAAPALVVHGDADIAIPLERAQALVDGLPHAELATIAGAGHASNLTHPAPVNAAIERFLAERTPREDG
jgi:pimeloyl-ACP methyl ester carboxylesterase